jgi:phenylacetate-CoA ligase
MAKPFATRKQIEAEQIRQLQQLMATIGAGNSFYQKKFSQFELRVDSLEDFAQTVPFTTKTEIVEDQRKHPPYGTNLSFPLERYTRFHQTSGTTGTPVRWLDTPQSWSALVDCWKEVYLAAEVKAGDRVFFAFSFGPFIGFWLAFEAADQLGCLSIPSGGLSSEARVRMIIDNEAEVLCCTPTYALHLAEVAAKNGIDLGHAKIRTLLVAGEPGGSIPATRQRLEQLWPGARVFDHHGMTEVGPVTFECPENRGVLHVMEAAYIPEIIDPATGQSVGSGEMGELILTTLRRIGSPLIRYRTGDLVKMERGGGCSCGRQEARLIGGILGRSDDMVIVRGVNIYPSAIEDVLRRFSEIAEYRVHFKQTGALAELSVEIEPANTATDATNLAMIVGNALQTAFNLRIPVKVAAARSLPRFEMKAKRWVRS